jgi:hypothetical protein
MVRIMLLFAMVAVMAAQASAGGVVCSIATLETDAELDQAAAELRAQGPQGLAAVIRSYLERKLSAEDQVKYQRVMDLVAGQRGALVSRLYWYTDLDEAKSAAAASGKPILSLRMLGKLTDEYSCANSRFFRTALYSNKEISDYLRDNYVLHWQSVRPVPRVTVDFGDGRKLERTVTGNSAHYVLDAEGRPLEALPGLYAPQAFQEWLVRSRELADRLAPSNDTRRFGMLLEYHANRRNIVDEDLRAQLALFAPELLKDPNAQNPTIEVKQSAKPTAREASFRAIAKSAGEAPLLAPFMPSHETLVAQDNDLWRQIAARRSEQSQLDEASEQVIRRENPAAEQAGLRAESKRRQEDPLVRMLENFEEAMALDTVKNEYLLHRQIHEWFVNRDVPAAIDDFNEKVYTVLFLTPPGDPWLGLAPQDVYTALDDGGLSARIE